MLRLLSDGTSDTILMEALRQSMNALVTRELPFLLGTCLIDFLFVVEPIFMPAKRSFQT